MGTGTTRGNYKKIILYFLFCLYFSFFFKEFVAKSEAARKELGRIGRTIVDSGKLKDYGTPPAQELLKKWAEKYGGKTDKKE